MRFGLCTGSSDLIGLRSLLITRELVGQRLAQFVAPEIKTQDGTLRPEQESFLQATKRLGALAREHPGKHHYTLALRLQARTGKILGGRQCHGDVASLSPA